MKTSMEDNEYTRAMRWLEHSQKEFSEYYDHPTPEETKEVNFDFFQAHLRQHWETFYSKLNPGMSFKDFADANRQAWTSGATAALTKFERPWQSFLINTMAANIRTALKDIGLHEQSRIVMGTLPTGKLNGMAVALPDISLRLVLLDSGIFGFANLAAKSVAASLLLVKGEGDQLMINFDSSLVTLKIANSQEVQKRFRSLIFAYLVGGHPHVAEPYLPTPEQNAVAAKIRDGMELFLLAHEFAHCVLGHLERVEAEHEDEAAQTIIKTMWNDEFEADELALKIVVHIARTEAKEFWAFCGFALFFGSDRAINNSLTLLRGDDSVVTAKADTHPPSSERLRRLYSIVERDYRNLDQSLEFARSVDHAMDVLWMSCDGMLLKMRHDKIELARGWREDAL